MGAFITPNKNQNHNRLMVGNEQSDPPIVESPKMTNIHAFINDADLQTADQMLKQTYRPLEYTQYANWLGAKENKRVLTEFLNLLRPWPTSLYLTLSKLSHGLYLIAEATPLDNILEELAAQWTDEHKDKVSHFQGNYRVCHIILFSLLILNSDLHNESFDYKFTVDQFIENTIYAIRYELKDMQLDEKLIKDDLRGYYNQILDIPFPLCQPRTFKEVSNKNDYSSTSNDSPSMNHSSMNPSPNERVSFSVSRKTSLFSLRPASSLLEKTTTSQSVLSSQSEWSQHVNATDFYVHQHEDDIFGKQNDSLWLVDHTLNFKVNKSTHSISEPCDSATHGIMKLFRRGNNLTHQQQRMENANRKMHRARVTVQKGSLELHLTKSKNKLSARSLTGPNGIFGTSIIQRFNLFGAFAELIGETIIDHTGASKPKCFQVEFADDQHHKSLIFECSSSKQCETFVDCINFWASRITPIPDSQFEMVSNQEYGWSGRILSEYQEDPNSFKVNPKIKVFHWEPLYGLDSLYTNFNVEESGKLNMDSQLLHWKIFVTKLAEWINEHNDIKPALIKIWTHNPNFDLIMDNWNAKYLYLNRQYHKHNEYLKAIEKSYENSDKFPIDK
ncbi:Arf family guanine nucleotide exchange factor YEL1 [Kluyveromyces lactis]|uniref:Guanine-nucleotide exchange factor YEL1 n=1 Tax=Kluyveromyces lactis (strain ATCC 8585 / CBS 2359 / DSM 70799 / NBRC 1267 / NRRL Y-1140 / WM37) TaxID=284590 RepID=Q6CMH3_KLULA|nr:uncharacterized protein KLLA0_E20219g [Kluyveromyces lactis]CAG99953.1 KLLA0E20219p [Kluyveromyces lactis]|eukprot:XP_454866.1 uncharacterized protein KLLA0_E20219g [Kluyveromyces lactis]